MRPITKFAIHATVAASLIAFAATSAAAAVDAFIWFSGAKGESGAKSAAGGQFEVSSWSWGAAQESAKKGWDGTIKGNPKVAAGDVDADGSAKVAAASEVTAPRDAGSGMPTGKRQHGWVTVSKPLDHGAVMVKTNLTGCTVGAAYADAVLQTPDARYEFKDAIITSCTMSGSTGGDDRPTESVSLSYGKVIVRGWNPEKKEE